jgi:hypothetical protein
MVAPVGGWLKPVTYVIGFIQPSTSTREPMTANTSIIGKFVAFLRQTFFCTRLEREIYSRVAPHLNHERNCGYPFTTFEEIEAMAAQGKRELLERIEIIERQAEHMGKAYGDAFRYIMYRELNRRMLQYLNLAQWRIAPELRVPEYA